MKTVLLLSLMTVLLISCHYNHPKDAKHKADSIANNSTHIDTVQSIQYFINDEYADCLSKHLPCACVVGNGDVYQVIIIDENNPKKIIGYNSNPDLDYDFDRVEEMNGTFNVYIYPIDTTFYFNYKFVDDTVYLNKDGKVYKYINYYQSEYNEDITTFIYQYNHYRLVELLHTKGFYIKQKLGYTDSIGFYCNNDMGGNNLLFQYKKNGTDWFVEEDTRNYYIYKWTDTVKRKQASYNMYHKELLYTIKK